jgi:hypothetical protein
MMRNLKQFVIAEFAPGSCNQHVKRAILFLRYSTVFLNVANLACSSPVNNVLIMKTHLECYNMTLFKVSDVLRMNC